MASRGRIPGAHSLLSRPTHLSVHLRAEASAYKPTNKELTHINVLSSRFKDVGGDVRHKYEDSGPSSYTATEHNIRGDTAELADCAMNEDSDTSAISERTIGRQTNSSAFRWNDPHRLVSEMEDTADEHTPLWPDRTHSYDTITEPRKEVATGQEAIESVNHRWSVLRSRMNVLKDKTVSAWDRPWKWLQTLGSMTPKDWEKALTEPVRLIPAAILGLFLNILDGVSYGMITFPTTMPIFANFGGDGVSMFFVTCIISQLIYTLGGSIFKGGNGSMMIEVVPFYHILVKDIVRVVGEDNGAAIVPTTMVAFALSSILTGLLFLLLGVFRLGVLISYFPRHILVGCIGGVGVFLMETGFSVSARIESEGGFKYNWDTIRQLTVNIETILQWLFPLGQAVLLNVIASRCKHPLLIPAYFLSVFVLFYFTMLVVLRMDMSDLWSRGWVFDIQEAAHAPFYRFYTYFDFGQTSWKAIWASMPTQMALVFFGILHVPLNVPALGVSVGEDNVDTDRELVAHGISNMTAGFLGTVPNYLCYVNSVLFYRVGGGSRLSGLMLAGATLVILLMGPSLIGYLPIMVVGALIFVLGLDLIREAVWDTWNRASRLEYLTILVIIVVMTLSDFVVGCLAGICLACVFFVMQTSRRNAVRTVFSGRAARSTVRRQLTQRRFLDDVSNQTQVLKLQGSLFFGTINSIETLVRKMLDLADWQHYPISFLIMDLGLVHSMDFSAVEAMTRIHRMLMMHGVHLVFCGLSLEGDVASALQSVDLWADEAKQVDVFASLNEALEWTENEYLRGLYSSNLTAATHLRQATMSGPSALRLPNVQRKPTIELDDTVQDSPRYQHLHEAAKRVTKDIQAHIKTGSAHKLLMHDEPHDDHAPLTALLPVLASTLGPYMEHDDDDSIFQLLSEELEEVSIPKDTIVWDAGERPDALYFIESGILVARYVFSQNEYEINEAMLAGTIAGELTFLAKQPRNTTVTAEMDTKVWRLDEHSMTKIAQKDTQAYSKLVQLLLRVTADEQDCLMSYLVARLN